MVELPPKPTFRRDVLYKWNGIKETPQSFMLEPQNGYVYRTNKKGGGREYQVSINCKLSNDEVKELIKFLIEVMEEEANV